MTGALVAAACSVALAASPDDGSGAPPPRVLLVTWDTTRADRIGAYGRKQARTPCVDALAANGVVYERAYASAPVTLPSHASLFTGVPVSAHGVRENGLFAVAPAARTLAEAFAESGCATAAFVGSIILGEEFGLAQGFATYDAPRPTAGARTATDRLERPADAVVEPALRFVDGLAADAPFFLWLHFYDPHFPFIAHAEPQLAGLEAYDAEIGFCDLQLRRVLDRLAARGLDRGLVTVVTSDHGESLGEHHEETHGIFVYDATMRVPLVVAPSPAGAEPGSRIAAPVALIDVAATLLERTGIGRAALPDSRAPALPASDAAADADRALLLESFTPWYSHRWHPLRAIVWKGAKLVDAPRRELYELADDPGELRDLAADRPEPAARLFARLQALVDESPPLGWGGTESVSPQESERLAQLGYLVRGGDAFGGEHDDRIVLPDAKDRIGDQALRDEVIELIREARARPASERAVRDAKLATARERVATLREHHARDPFVDSLTFEIELVAGNAAAARDPLERVTAEDPRTRSHHHNLALVYAALGDADLARREMEKAAYLDPAAVPSLTWLVQDALRRNATPEAQHWLAQLLSTEGLTAPERASMERLRSDLSAKADPRANVFEPAPVGAGELLPERWLLSADAAAPSRVLLVTLDTTRADHLGCYGRASARTPFLDRLAAEGARFTQAWCAAPITLPSHATILTGVDPRHHGVRDNGIFALSQAATTLPEVLRERGFATAAFVGSFVLDPRFGLAQGFDVYGAPVPARLGLAPEVVQRPASAVVDEALRWLGGLGADASFFLWVHFYDPHAPHAGSYDAEIATCDAELARLHAALVARGFDRGLLEVVTADHGEGLGEHGEGTHGFLLHDATMRVPLLVRGAGIPAGATIDAPVTNGQIAATVLQHLGVDASALPSARFGPLPLKALLAEPAEGDERELLLETLLPFHSHRWHPLQAIVARGRKLVRGSFDELFDLAADPGETKDLAASEPEVARALARRLEAAFADAGELGWSDHVTLSEEERQRLREQGYAAAAGDSSGAASDPSLPDPRRAIADDGEQQRALALVQQARELLGQEALVPGAAAAAPRTPAQRERGAQLLEQARTILLGLATKHPLDPSLAFDLGNVELSAGRHADAARWLTQAVAGDPSNATGHYNFAIALAGSGEVDAAIVEMEKAIHCEPRLLTAWRWLVTTHSQRGELGRAVWWADRVEESKALEPADLAPMRATREQLRERMKAAGQQPTPSPTFPPKDLTPEQVQGRRGSR